MENNQINEFFKLSNDVSNKRINSLVGKDVIIHFYRDKKHERYTEAVMELQKYEDNKLIFSDGSSIIDDSDVKGIEECKSEYQVAKEMIGVPVRITNIYDKQIDAVILSATHSWIFIEFDNKQSEYLTYLIKNIELI